MSVKHRGIRADTKKEVFEIFFSNAKTVVFFSGQKINRFALFEDRASLRVKNLKLTKVNNVVLNRILRQSNLKLLNHQCHSYNLVAFSNTILESNMLGEVLSLKYNNIIMTGALSANVFYTPNRLVETQTLNQQFKKLPSLFTAPYMTYNKIQTFVNTKILDLIKA